MTFQSFIREPRTEERYGAGWSPPGSGQESCPVRARLARLARRLYLPHPWRQSGTPSLEAWENPGIPAGYTYLSQFVAHDTVHSTVSTSALRRPGQRIRNGRSAPLELETLYGAGFDGCLTAMSDGEREQLRPSKLRLGRIRIGDSVSDRCPFRDIPRSRPAHTTEFIEGLPSTLLADDRNDNNVFISQVTMLFTLFHNTMVDLIHAARPPYQAVSQAYFAELYCDAGAATVRTYRHIVRSDLMRRLLHPEVFAFYDGASGFIDRRHDAAITLEFAQALRFGHAMVRPHYKVNDLLQRREELIDVLLTTSRSRPWRLPLDESWPIQWSKFFQLGDSRPNLSKRIAPSLSADLISDLAFDRIDETNSVGLAYRDLVNGTGAPLWAITPLIREIEARAPGLIGASRLLADEAYRLAALRAWLSCGSAGSILTEDDISDLSRDPPLWLFVLFEAALEMQGERLGVLGSILIGEGIFKVLRISDQDLSGEASPRHGETERIKELSKVANMADLVRFVHRNAAIDESLIPFL